MSEVTDIELTPALQQKLTADFAWKFSIIPKSFSDELIEVFADEKLASQKLNEELEMFFDKKIHIEKLPSPVIQKALAKYYRKSSNGARSISKNFTTDNFLYSLISEAKELDSSDIHIESYKDRCRVRFRIDGLLVERHNIKKSEYPALVNKIKIDSRIDIAESRLPQDGRILFDRDGLKFDIRVSTLPTIEGEKIVLRLLNNDSTNIDINQLGFSEHQLRNYLQGIKKSKGIVLISGPTGSGKTTTLYATLKILNNEKSNILTIENPVEYTLDGVNQVQVKESIDFSFARALRAFLRQDPDIIMLGEIRDSETAQMAVRAALTGHLVLSTIHTNSAWGIISRLTDMDIAGYLLADTINTAVAQRLVRLLCNDCKSKEKFDPALLPDNHKIDKKIEEHYVACGCENCHYTGYKKRKAIYEIIPIDRELAECIRDNKINIIEQLKKRNIKLLNESAFELFEQGHTSLQEIYPHLL